MARERGRSRGMARWGACLALVAALAGCGGEEGADRGARTRPPAGESSGVVALPERQATRDGMITIEGTTEPMRFHLFRSPESFPLAFSTYLPDDLVATGGGEGEVRWVAGFAGTPDPRASLSIRLLPEGTDEPGALAATEEAVAALGQRVEDGGPAAEPWARATHRFRAQDGSVGALHLGEHAGRYFHLVVVSPAEMSEGFGPRVEHVLDEWRWEDSGEGLRREIRY